MKSPIATTRPTFFFRVVPAAALLLAVGGAPVFASLLVHEPFEYERRQGYVNADIPGEGIDGLNGGLGFSGGWTRVPVTEVNDLNAGIPAGEGDYGDGDTYGISLGARTAPLSYTDANHNRLISSGNQIRTAFGNRSWNRRDLTDFIGAGGQTVWLSFLAQAHGLAGSTRYAFVELASWGGTDRFWIGNVTPVSNGNWGLQLPDRTGGSVSADLGLPMNVPTMFLARLQYAEFSQHLTISVWLNPADLTDESALPEPLYEVETDFTYFALLGVAGRYSTDFDEIRIGTTFDAVTPSEFVPPPPEAPKLTIARGEGTVTVSWPAAASGFSLYVSEDLVSWEPAPDGPVIQGDMNVVEIVTIAERMFFRLQE